MARISKYVNDTTIQGSDRLVGSNTDGTTKNFAIEDIVAFTANTNAAGVIGQLPYMFFNSYFGGSSTQPEGSMAITDLVETSIQFVDVTTLRISTVARGYDVDAITVITAFGGGNIIIANNQDPDAFAIYTCTAATVDPTDSNFYNLTLSYTSGSGSLIDGGYYSIASRSAGVSLGIDGQIPFVNATNDNLAYSSGLHYGGTELYAEGDLRLQLNGQSGSDFRIYGVGSNTIYMGGGNSVYLLGSYYRHSGFSYWAYGSASEVVSIGNDGSMGARLGVKGRGITTQATFLLTNSADTELLKVLDNGTITDINGNTFHSLGTDGQIPFTNVGGTDLSYSASFTRDENFIRVRRDANVNEGVDIGYNTSVGPQIDAIGFNRLSLAVQGTEVAYVTSSGLFAERLTMNVAGAAYITLRDTTQTRGYTRLQQQGSVTSLQYFNGSSFVGAINYNESSQVTIGNDVTSLGARLGVKGEGTTTGTTFLLEDSAGTDLLKVTDDGQFYFLGNNPKPRIQASGVGEYGLAFRNSLNTANYHEISIIPTTGEIRHTAAALFFPTWYSNNAEAMRINTSGNVGISEASPTARLHVKGSGTTSGTTALLVQNSDGTDKLNVTDDGTVTIFDGGVLKLKSASNNYTATLYADGTDLVLTARRDIEIKSTDAAGDILLLPMSGNNGWRFDEEGYIAAKSNNSGSIYSGSNGFFGYYSIGNTLIYNAIGFDRQNDENDGVFLQYKNLGTHYVGLKLTKDGNVGIGVSSPTARTHIVGSGTTSATTTFLAQNSAGTDLLKVTDDGAITHSGALTTYTNFTVKATDDDTIMRVSQGGGGGGILEVFGSTGGNSVRFHYSSQPSYIITSPFGLGTSNPSTKFHNTGDSTLDGDVFVGGNIGIGTTSPTAFIDLAAATTAKASLRMRSGVDPTAPNSGDLWFDGTSLKFYDGTTTTNLLSGGGGGGGGGSSPWTTSGSDIYYDTGSVGINTGGTNLGRLHVKGGGTTSATTALLVQNSSTDTLWLQQDSGNIGWGTSDVENWHTIFRAIEGNGSSLVRSHSTAAEVFIGLMANAYHGQTGGFKHKHSKGAAYIFTGSTGGIKLRTAPSRTANSTLTWVDVLHAKTNGNLNLPNLPTSSSGLASGDLWNNSGVINIV